MIERVDAHHHVWDQHGFSYLLPDLLADFATGHDVVPLGW